MSAYYVNRATGEALPGLLSAQDVSHFHGVADSIRNIDEANAKKLEFEATEQPDTAAMSGPVQSPADTTNGV